MVSSFCQLVRWGFPPSVGQSDPNTTAPVTAIAHKVVRVRMARHVIPRKLRGQFGAVLLETRIQDLADIVLSGIDAGQYLEPMKTTVSSRGRIVLPAELRQQDAIEAGQEFKLVRLNRGEYRLVRVEQVDIVGEKQRNLDGRIGCFWIPRPNTDGRG